MNKITQITKRIKTNIGLFVAKTLFQKVIFQTIFNKIGGLDYGIYKRCNVIEGSELIDYFVLFDGSKYYVDGYSDSMVEETRIEYDWSDIRPDDIVLDLGANIGGFTIGAALKAKHVYAVEPIFYKNLKANVQLNDLSNVTILPVALGDGRKINISFNKQERKDVMTHTLSKLLNYIETEYSHKVTVIKCDIEGHEWFIKPSELDGIRRIEMEIHPKMFPTESYNSELVPYMKKNWVTTSTYEERETYVLHAYEEVKTK